MTTISKYSYKIVWLILKYAAIYYDYLTTLCKMFSLFFRNLSITSCKDTPWREMEFLQQFRDRLQKVPKHFSVIIGRDAFVGQDILSKITTYALALNIEYISFYDTRELLTLDKLRVPDFVTAVKTANGNHKWTMREIQRKSISTEQQKDTQKSIEIVILQSTHGKTLFTEVCKDLFIRRDTPEIQEALKDRNSLAKKITECLGKRLNHLPNPECAVVLSRNLRTFGVLPWSTGFTELHLIKPYSWFDVNTFASIFTKYSDCDQRCGR